MWCNTNKKKNNNKFDKNHIDNAKNKISLIQDSNE